MTNHAGRKPYECKTCRKAFGCPSDLWIHEITHIGEKPYECRHCGNAFFFTQPFEDMRMYTVETSYECSWCEEAFCSEDMKGITG